MNLNLTMHKMERSILSINEEIKIHQERYDRAVRNDVKFSIVKSKFLKLKALKEELRYKLDQLTREDRILK